MIKVDRGPAPAALASARVKRLAKLPVDGSCPARSRSFDDGYKTVKGDLQQRQYFKCCYCEQIQVPIHNDVEHYRPWSRYWWLAWNWDNLLFACRACNQTGGKLDGFPLSPGSEHLSFGEQPPGRETPELVDPAGEDPRDHIRFALDPNGRWGIRAVSWRGRITLHTLGLLRDEFRVLFNTHVVDVVQPVVDDIRDALVTRERAAFEQFWYRKCDELLCATRPFRSLSQDVLCHEFPTFPGPPP